MILKTSIEPAEAELEHIVSISIPMKPVGKQRPRVTSHGTYTPSQTKAAEQIIQAHARNTYRGQPWHCPIALYVEVHLLSPVRPKNAHHPVVKPDWDNYGKLVSDALNGLVYHDDSQIVFAEVRKLYSNWEGFKVHIFKYP